MGLGLYGRRPRALSSDAFYTWLLNGRKNLGAPLTSMMKYGRMACIAHSSRRWFKGSGPDFARAMNRKRSGTLLSQ